MIPVLDYGYVRFVDKLGTDESIVAAARMSTDGAFRGWGTPENPGDEKLLGYLWRNGHVSPFEFCTLVVEMQIPIFVERQLVRHWSLSINEMSARYVQMPNLHYVPSAERVCYQSKSRKQGSGEPLSTEAAEDFCRDVETAQHYLYAVYERYLSAGIARELARINTPVSRYTRVRVSGLLRDWLFFLSKRLAHDAQWEMQEYAKAIASIVAEHWPRTWALFEEGRKG